MPASEARINANRNNAQKSTGPRTEAGKEASRANSFKHGLTGAGVVMTPGIAAEVKRRTEAFVEELRPSGEVGLALARRAAFLSVRLDIAMDQENRATDERVRRAQEDFVSPEGVEAAEADRLRREAVRTATCEITPDVILRRKYEASAERGMLRTLKELRQVERASRADVPSFGPEDIQKLLGSFDKMDHDLDEMEAKLDRSAPMPPISAENRRQPTYYPPMNGVSEVPIAIGRPG